MAVKFCQPRLNLSRILRLRTWPVEEGLLVEVGEDATQETLRDARLCTLLFLAMVAFIPVDCISLLGTRTKNLLKFNV